MRSPFKLINELAEFLEPLDVEWFVSGGWAIDIHFGKNTRDRGDLDISVPWSGRLAVFEFFLDKGWQIEGKLYDGFKTLRSLSDYEDGIRYFWSFTKGVDFIGEYMDEQGNRRISYDRQYQFNLDYIEVFFDTVDEKEFVYRRDDRIRRNRVQAILERDEIRYLAPEIVLLFKSSDLSEKNTQDFNSVLGELDNDQKLWLSRSLSIAYQKEHPWKKALVK